MKKTSFLLAATALALLAGGVHAQPVARNGVLADSTGRTLYIFDKDMPGKSNCTGGCLTAWPAFMAKPTAKPDGDFDLVVSNGASQWAFKGKPLYYFAGDANPGERNGDGSGGSWHVVPASTPSASSSAKY